MPLTGFRGFRFLVSGCTKVDFVVGGGFRGFRFLGSGFRASDWISWISLFRQTPWISWSCATFLLVQVSCTEEQKLAWTYIKIWVKKLADSLKFLVQTFQSLPGILRVSATRTENKLTKPAVLNTTNCGGYASPKVCASTNTPKQIQNCFHTRKHWIWIVLYVCLQLRGLFTQFTRPRSIGQWQWL